MLFIQLHNIQLIARNVLFSYTKGYYFKTHQRCLNVMMSERRRCSTSTQSQLTVEDVQKTNWNRVVSDAEKIVGYPTSFLNLRWLLNDKIADVALHLKKLVGSNHPLLKTAINLLYNDKNNMQAWGLIVLLVSKAAGYITHVPDIEQDKMSGVLHSQRALAEIMETIRKSYVVRQGMVNLQPLIKSRRDLSSDLTFGNKIALLTGDYMLVNSFAELAALRNQELVGLIASAVRDLAESEFIGERDEQNNPLPSKPITHSELTTNFEIDDDNWVPSDNLKPINKDNCMGMPEREWALRHILSAASLLSKSCQGSLKLAGHPVAIQKNGYLFAKHLSLAWQAYLDKEPFHSNVLPPDTTFSLVSAPVLFHLQYDSSMYTEIEKGYNSIENINYEKIYGEIIKGPGLEKTNNLQRKHTLMALQFLDLFPHSDARTALKNIILAMRDV